MAAEKMEAATGRRRNGRTVDFEMGKAERGGVGGGGEGGDAAGAIGRR